MDVNWQREKKGLLRKKVLYDPVVVVEVLFVKQRKIMVHQRSRSLV